MSRLTDEEVWLRAWEAAALTLGGSQVTFSADCCLADFRQRFRADEDVSWQGPEKPPVTYLKPVRP